VENIRIRWVIFHSASRVSQTAQGYRAYDATVRVSRFTFVIAAMTKMAAQTRFYLSNCVALLSSSLMFSSLCFRSPLNNRWILPDAGYLKMPKEILNKDFSTLLSLLQAAAGSLLDTGHPRDVRISFEELRTRLSERNSGCFHARVENELYSRSKY